MDASLFVIEGTLSICNTCANVLIDPRCTHSFVRLKFISRLNVSPNTMPHVLVVSTQEGDTVLSDQVYKSCNIRIERHELFVDLIILDMQDFNAILVMDLLSIYHAKLVYFIRL